MAARLSAFAKLLSFPLIVVAVGSLLPIDEVSYSKLIESHRAKVVLVDFWATWCEPCRVEMPMLAALQKKIGFVLLTVSADEPEQEFAAFQFLAKSHVPMPGWIKHAKSDHAFIDAVDPKWNGALPGLFLYDRNGKLRRSFVGETSREELEAALKQLIP